ncbi:MAG: hypothetical protein ACTFAK_11105 [Candidatus Electronema sp. VV]
MKSAMSARICFLPFICIMSCFMLLGLTRLSFSATCSGLVDGLGYKNGSASCVYQMHVTYYDCQSLASDACNAAGGGCSTFSNAWFFSATGAGLPFGTLGYWRRGSVIGCDGTSDDIYIYVACAAGTCEPSSPCADERAEAEQLCGISPDAYDIDEFCNWRCRNLCREEARETCHDKPFSSSTLGGIYDPAANTKWWDDSLGLCRYECNCPSYDGSIPYIEYDFQTCQRIPSSTQCQDEIESKRQLCKLGLSYANYETCVANCNTCDMREKECSEKCEYGGKVYDCNESQGKAGFCICTENDCTELAKICDSTICADRGGSLSFDCASGSCICKYDAKSCSEMKEECVSKCSSKGGARSNECIELDGKVRSFVCECVEDSVPLPPISDYEPKQKTCADYQADCNPSCTFACSTGADGYAHEHSCDCSIPSTPPDDGGDDDPSDDPSDGDDGNGWLKSIKENTDTLIGQGNDVKNWLGSLKENSDKSLGLDSQRNESLDSISRGTDIIITNQGIMVQNMSQNSKDEIASVLEVEKDVEKTNDLIGGKGGTNELISGINQNLNGVGENIFDIEEGIVTSNQKLDGIGGTLTDIKEGFSDVDIGTGTAGGDYSVNEGDYGSAPADSDLPAADAMQSAFGSYSPAVDGNRDLIKSIISGFVPEVVSPDCNPVLSLPVPTFSGLVWHDYPLNFCQYESLISIVGSVLVFLTALYELYRLA